MNTALQYYRTLPRVLINEKDLCILSFFKENTVDTFAEAARNVDNVAFDVVNFANRTNKELIYTDLQNAPISQLGYLTKWNDQTGGGYHAVAEQVGRPYLVGNNFIAQRNLRGNNAQNLRIASSNLLQDRAHVTLFFVFESSDTAQGRWYYRDASFSNIYMQVDAGELKYRIRRINTDAYTVLTVPFFAGIGVVSLDINYTTGAVAINVNGVLGDSDTLATTGNSQNAASVIAFDRGSGGSGGLANAEYPLYYFGVSQNLTAPEIAAKETALIARYVSTALLTGGDIYQLFDVIISPDRLSPYPYAINVRRSSDNAEQVISHVNGLFDVASFDTFKGAGDGFANRVLDQAAPQRAFRQTVASVQLQIVSNLFNGRAGFQGNNAARRSIAKSFSLNTKGLHYYFFIPCQLDSLSGEREDLFAFRNGLPVRMGGGIIPISGNARLNTLSQRVDADVVKQVTGTTNIALATKVLLSYAFDFENGIIRGWINQDVEINDTTGHEGTSIGQVSIIHFMNVGDNSIVAFNGKTAGIFYVQGEQTDAQLEAIRTELLQTYIL